MQLSDESLKKFCYFRINKQVQLLTLSFFLTQDSPLKQIQPAFMLFLLTNPKTNKKRMKIKRKFSVLNKSDDKSYLYNTLKT